MTIRINNPAKLKNLLRILISSFKNHPFKYIIVIIIASLWLINRLQYRNPKDIDLKVYEPVVQELSAHRGLADSLHDLSLRYFPKAALEAFPETYALLQQKQVVEIECYSEGCIYIVLEKHTRPIEDKWECLKIGNSDNCGLANNPQFVLEEKTPLAPGWEYQLVGELPGIIRVPDRKRDAVFSRLGGIFCVYLRSLGNTD